MTLAQVETSPRYHLLDVGKEKYGDCVLCVFPGPGDAPVTVLIDGGHASDYKGQSGCRSIPEQIGELLGGDPPWDISLLVVSHCHSDHIGCLPELVANDDIRVRTALVADEAIGYGPPGGDAAGDPRVGRLVAALREERHDHLPGGDLDAFIDTVDGFPDKYRDMLAKLAGTSQVLRYRGRNQEILDLEADFAAIGLRVLGPSADHLKVCGDAIAAFSGRAMDAVRAELASAPAVSDAVLYRKLVREGYALGDAADMAGKGSALNDTSIVLRLGAEGAYVLLTGDMQFAAPELPGLEGSMDELFRTVVAAGPYAFIKTPHHTSYNGLDADRLGQLRGTEFFGHSGGVNDPSHPDAKTLELLKANGSWLTYLRTDRNGQIEYDPATHEMTYEKGRTNDFTPNRPHGHSAPDLAPGGTAAGPQAASRARVHQTARIPWGNDAITLTLEGTLGEGARPPAVDLGTQPAAEDLHSPVLTTKASRVTAAATLPSALGQVVAGARGQLAGGRPLPRLLFVTDLQHLKVNVGTTEAEFALKMIKDANQEVCDVGSAARPLEVVRQALHQRRHGDHGYEGVVLVGGYDVLPAQRLDVLTPALRSALGQATYDEDDFIVWSDCHYADVDGDGFPDLPVSRIPDANASMVLLKGLTATPCATASAFGIRNSKRPFADQVWQDEVRARHPAVPPLLQSGPEMVAQLQPGQIIGPWTYFMLHGSDADGTRYFGETPGFVEAFNVGHVPSAYRGVVFAGCCWGGLVAVKKARDCPNGPVAQRTVGASIALSLLAAGAQAYIGCTGEHYSPSASFPAAEPFHRAFWRHLAGEGKAPAPALHAARLDYLRGMPFGQTDAFDQAVERKLLMQFTCLGLGW